MNITQVPSPNYTPGRSKPITKVVIHWMDGTLGSTDIQFTNPETEVSAHYGIEDNKIHQYVREGDTAWHAKQANPYTIGIEHSAQPGRDATPETINTSAQLVADICSRHNIAINSGNIIPHSQVVATQCPGTIPINEIINKALAIIKGEDMPNSGDVTNVYKRINNKVPDQHEIQTYTTKPWNAPDGLYYGKVDIDIQNLQKALKDADTDDAEKIKQIKEILGA